MQPRLGGTARGKIRGMIETPQLSAKVAISRGRIGNGVFCTEAIQAGEPLFLIAGERVAKPDTYTIQMDAETHVAPAGATWAMMNHACAPNAAIDFASWRMLALSGVLPGEEVTFNYLTTEWDMASPFRCLCGAPHCPGIIRGFRHLGLARRLALRELLSPFLASRLYHALTDGQSAAMEPWAGPGRPVFIP